MKWTIGLFSSKWANGTKYCGLYRTSVGNVLIAELGNRSEFLRSVTLSPTYSTKAGLSWIRTT